MLTFSQFLSEQKNLHLTHLEDQVLNGGVSGTKAAIDFLRSLRDMLAGHHRGNPVRVTTKWDGAPAIFAGINPENGKFFVGTKSVFNKKTPKINYTRQDIYRNHSGNLAKKLEVALKYLPYLNIRGVVQGDMMFTPEDLHTVTIDGKSHVTFRPNTITYAVPEGSDTAKRIRAAKMGIVVHTTYSGSKMADMSASFNASVTQFSRTPHVWVRDADFVDASGAATFNISDTVTITNILSRAGRLFNQVSAATLNKIAVNQRYHIDILAYNNSKIRSGQEISNISSHVDGLIKYVDDKLSKHVDTAKTQPTREKREAEKKIILGFYRKNRTQLQIIFELMNQLNRAKLMIVRKLQKVKQIGTFIQTDDGFRVTSPEGFVAIDHIGSAVKLVDRMEFSHQNFTLQKNWDS